MINKSVALFILSFLFCLQIMGENRIYFIRDSLKYGMWEGDSSVVVMDVSPTEPLPVNGDGTLVIPATVTFEGHDYPVEGVEKYAFYNRMEIRHLVVSDGVWGIREYAFRRCANLESVCLPASLEYIEPTSLAYSPRLQKIVVDAGNSTYDSRDDCNAVIETDNHTLLLGCKDTRIPMGVACIGQCAFEGQLNCDEFFVPEGIVSIEDGAFLDCMGLKHISLPSSLESIGDMAFWGCVSLDSVCIPHAVAQIGKSSFYGCHALKHIEVSAHNPFFDSRENCNAIIRTREDSLVQGCGATRIVEGIKSIGENAFWGSSLTEIHIPSTVTSIAPNAFGRCRFCTSIDVDPGNAVYDSHGDCNAIIETVTGKLVKGCGLTVIPKEVREIGEYAFSGMCMPANFVVPEGVQTIGGSAFSGCNFYNVRLPKSLRSIGSCAFADCKLLNTVDADSPELYVGSDAFRFCYSLESVRLPSRVIFENNTVFEYCPFQKIYEEIYAKP